MSPSASEQGREVAGPYSGIGPNVPVSGHSAALRLVGYVRDRGCRRGKVRSLLNHREGLSVTARGADGQ